MSFSLAKGVKVGPNEKYVLVEKIGEGASSEVWRATDTSLGRDVALKKLNPLLGDPGLKAEAQRIAQLSFTGIVQIYEVLEVDGSVILVEELVDGETLLSFLRRKEAERSWPVVDEAVGIIRRLLESVRFAHSRGIIHRDLTPKNIMITPLGEPKIEGWTTLLRTWIPF